MGLLPQLLSIEAGDRPSPPALFVHRLVIGTTRLNSSTAKELVEQAYALPPRIWLLEMVPPTSSAGPVNIRFLQAALQHPQKSRVFVILHSRLSMHGPTEPWPAIRAALPFDGLASYLHPRGLPFGYTDGEYPRGCCGSHRLLFLPNPTLLASRAQLATAVGAHKSSDVCRRVLSIGDTGRAHGFAVDAAFELKLKITVVTRKKPPSSRCTSGQGCSWESWSRARLVDELRDARDLCFVVVPLTADVEAASLGTLSDLGDLVRRGANLGAGLTTVMEAVAMGRPVLTLRHDHFRGYLEDGCNAVLIPPPARLGRNLTAADYALGMRRMQETIARKRSCAGFAAQDVTVEAVAARFNESLDRLLDSGRRLPLVRVP